MQLQKLAVRRIERWFEKYEIYQLFPIKGIGNFEYLSIFLGLLKFLPND
jgi:hypothetical protein